MTRIKRLLIPLIALLTVLLLFGCSGGGEGPDNSGSGGSGSSDGGNTDNGGADENITGDHIFAPSTATQVVYNGNSTDGDVAKFVSKLRQLVGNGVTLVTDSAEQSEHEIVIGESKRSISERAYKRLERLEGDGSEYCGFVVYSDGNSVAIAFDEDYFGIEAAKKTALGYFEENYLGEEVLRLHRGVIKSELVNIVEYQDAKDNAMIEARWDAVLADLTHRSNPELAGAVVRALRECYILFDDGVIDWFANLYDPITGGFYYSNSGRDTVGYGPDLESTYQALSFINGTGMSGDISSFEGDDVVPPWVCDKILEFAMGLQDPVSGYFYHPQWGGESFEDRRELIDKGYTSRRGRDLKWALSLISRFGRTPTYDIPAIGFEGSGILYDGSPASSVLPSSKGLISHLGRSTVSAVSSVVAVSSSIPEHLQSVENMRAYLKTLDVNGDSYAVGNLFESQSNQIVERDKKLDPSGLTTPLATEVKNYFDSHQNLENGAWTPGDKIDYESVNGILKICGAYNGIKKEFPNPIKAIRTAMVGITLDEPPTTVCYVLNPWYAITMLIQNVELYNSSPDKLGIQAEISELRAEILKNAVELIEVTERKTAKFAKDDGSFSYFPETSGPNSQGVPVALPETSEGDVNATHMFISGIPNHIFGILGCEMVPVFTTSDLMRYWNILNGLGAIIKDEVVLNEVETYDNETKGELPYGVTASYGMGSQVGIVSTQAANGSQTLALGFTTVPGNADILRMPLTYYEPFYNAVVFEMDIKIESAGGGGQIDLFPYGSPGDAYRIIIDYAEGGNVSVRNPDDFTSVTIGAEGEWIRFAVQYSFANIDYDRNGTKDLYVKLFANGREVAEGYTPYGTDPVSEGSVSGIRFASWTAANATMFIDNTLFYQDRVELKPAPIVNPEDEAERLTFEGSTVENLPGKLSIADISGSSTVTVTDIGTVTTPDKVFRLNSPVGASDVIKLFVTKHAEVFNALALDGSFMIDTESDGAEIELSFTTAYGNTAARLLLSSEGDSIVLKAVTAQGQTVFSTEAAKVGEWFSLRVEYVVFADGALVSASVNGALVASGIATYDTVRAAENIQTVKLRLKDNAALELSLNDLMLEQLVILDREGEDTAEDGITFEDETLESVADSITVTVSDKGNAEIAESIRRGRVTRALRLVSPKNSLDALIFRLAAAPETEEGAVNTVIFEADIRITDADGGNVYNLYHKTADGRIASHIIFGWSAASGNIFVQNSYRVDSGTSKDFDVVVVPEGYNSYFRLRLEYTRLSDGEARIGFFVNGEKLSTIDKVHSYSGATIDAAEITDIVLEAYSGRKSTLFVDNLSLGRTSVIPEIPEEPDTPDTPDVPVTPGEEYDGSIYDDTTDGNVSKENWS